MNPKRLGNRHFVVEGLTLALVGGAVVIAAVVLRAGTGYPTLVLLEEQPPERIVAIVEGQEVSI